MKITSAHYEYMRAAIAKIATPEKLAAHRQFIINEGRVQDVEKRLRWDMSYYANLTPWICAHIYPYADDTHVDTALRHIIASLETKESAQ